MRNIDIRFNRERFDKGNKFYKDLGINPQTAKLRIEEVFVAGQGSYDFDLKKAVKSVTERILKRNDLFVCTAIGVALMVETVGKEGHAPLLSYPMLDGLHLPTGLKGFANLDAEAVYNGDLSLKTGQSVNYAGFPMDKFRFVPETQPVAMLTSADVVVSSQLVPQFAKEQVMYQMPEELILAGTQDHKINISFPVKATSDIKGPANTVAKLVLLFDGYLYEGATAEQYKNDKNNPYRLAI